MDLQNCGTSDIRTIVYGCFVRLCSPCIQERYVDGLSIRAEKFMKTTL